MAISSFSDLSPPTSATFLLAIIAIIISIPIYHAFLSPLSRIPGPLPCRLIPLWLWYHSYLGDEVTQIERLHKIHGPIVRIGPKECSISDGAALNAIYSEHGGFRKADCYENFDFEGHATIFSARDGEYRATRSKAVAPLFSTANIRAGQEAIEACVERFVERMRAEAKTGEPVDVLNLSRSLALDAVSSFLFRKPYGGIEEQGDRLSASVFVDMLVEAGRFFILPHYVFVLANWLNAKLSASVDAAAEAGGAKLDDFARQIVRDTAPNEDTFQGRLKKADVSDDENAVQVVDLMFAGTDSTGTNLGELIWRLAKCPEIYQRLRNEVASADAANPSLSYNPQNLKYLDAVVREGLRMGMSTPTRLPRVVPKGGWSFNGFYLPEDTVVGCQLHTLHFNPEVFPDPLEFRPERWLDRPSPEMQRDWIPFSLGQRGCLARNLAQSELQLALRAIARTNLLEGATAVSEDIKIYEWFNSKLVGDKLELVWPAETNRVSAKAPSP